VPKKPDDDTTIELVENPVITSLKALRKPIATVGRPEKALPVLGFVGKTELTDDFIVLYLELDLAAYYRIPKKDLLYILKFPENPNEPVTVMVAATAIIELVVSGEASFITGRITATVPFRPDDPQQDDGPPRFPTGTFRGCGGS
jgi:hypothetical protein